MKVFVKGQGAVTLTQQNFVALGGQASVYVKDGRAYKIYTDPKHAIPDAKFQMLAGIQDPCVIKPETLLLNEKNVSIGYAMKAVAENFTLCQFFTRSFRDRNHVTQDQILTIAEKLQGHVQNVHKADALIVDLNEMNVLVPKTFDDDFLIDVDSYQVKGYPATVVMPSVRDYTINNVSDFSALSDWFSYAVLAFQLFIGAHPYKGSHAASNSVPKEKRLEHRMRQHISAFRKDVTLPGCCYSFDVIPQTFRDWLKAVLEDGKRLQPPSLLGGPAVVITTQMLPFLVASGNLTIQEAKDLEGRTLVHYVESNGDLLLLTTKGSNDMRISLNNRVLYSGPFLPGDTLIGFTPKMNDPVALNLEGRQLTFLDLSRKKREVVVVTAHGIAKSGERFYVRGNEEVFEVEFLEMPDKVVTTASNPVANIMELASTLYEGVVLQNMLGSVFASFFPRSNVGCQVRIPELDSYKIVEAKADGTVMMVIGAKNGVYDRMIFRFDEDFTVYDLRVVQDITPSGLNFVTLASKVCVSMTEEEKIEAFSSKKGAQGLKVVEDPALGSNMRLLKVAGKVGFERAGKIYQMSLK
jgi:hypothetical protein